jgi:CheY-like chemotaxis protein
MEAVGQLTGGVAHDFNNMLAVVIGALDIARKRLTQGNTNIAHLIDNAIEGAKRGATLTQRLLAFSRQQALEPQVLDVNRLVGGLSEMIRRSIGEAVSIEVVQGAGLWSVYADANQLENAIVNLAVNGRDAMPQGGRLTIETANVDLDARYALENRIMPGPHVLISVTDTGSGMPPDVAARAFDPFFTTKAVGQGTGLGLSPVFGFVKQTGGHVKIYSELNRGTSVKIYLRRHDAAAPRAETRPPEKDVAEGHRPAVVLVVEDDDTVRMLTVAGLEELGYTVVATSHAKDALKVLDERRDIGLLLTDVVMPGITGRQLAEQAAARIPGLKIMFTTGYTRNAIVHNGALDAGVHLLTKPFTLEQLSQAVRRVMQG